MEGSIVAKVKRKFDLQSAFVDRRAKQIKKFYEEVQEKILCQNVKDQWQANKHKRPAKFKEGDLVWIHLRKEQVGLGLIGFGIFFTFLAVILFFDKGLLALGNIFWLTGVALLLGWQSTWKLFTSNYKGTGCFVLGLFFLFVRWPLVGMILEIYGCIALFGGFWPTVKVFLFQIPVVGWIIQYPLMCNAFRSNTITRIQTSYYNIEPVD
ncbi:vesicle transport protein GOT1-like [Pistacia vera]|uniref:vesicle transport protein GOT1-like n=1 Tax=Pistacia vera TaxID=55513 RepID=UPI001262ECD9|nr:vesicle transport protein GOT1-like [Pistacia vera]